VCDLRMRIEAELQAGILPFWLNNTIDEEYGRFRGQIANDLTVDPHAAKGLILNARILWAFSKAFGVYKEPAYLAAARRAYEYLCRHFWDDEFGGMHWMACYAAARWKPGNASMGRRLPCTLLPDLRLRRDSGREAEGNDEPEERLFHG
jgi:mannose/cellobiose epimerase-like protein (N-acyl-D-glucosamine 2-epimerase family)